jgi:hypothetical protein
MLLGKNLGAEIILLGYLGRFYTDEKCKNFWGKVFAVVKKNMIEK